MSFSFSPKIATEGLVLYLDAANPRSYPGSGTTWSDISRGGNNGTLVNGPTYSSANGGSIVFDGSNDQVQCTSTPTIDITSTISLEMMIYPTTTNQNSGIVSKWTTGAGTNNSYLFSLGQDLSISRYGFYIYQSNNSTRALLPTTTYNNNIWTHIVCTADGLTMRIYNNGIVDPTTQTYDGTIKSTTKKLIIGSLREEDNLYSYNGRIAFCKIYNRALSATEVRQNYNAHKSRYGLT